MIVTQQAPNERQSMKSPRELVGRDSDAILGTSFPGRLSRNNCRIFSRPIRLTLLSSADLLTSHIRWMLLPPGCQYRQPAQHLRLSNLPKMMDPSDIAGGNEGSLPFPPSHLTCPVTSGIDS